MKPKFNSKYTTISAYTIFTFLTCLLIVILIFKISIVQKYIGKLLAILSPVIWGLVIAYLLNPFLKFVEKYISKITERKKPRRRLTRNISITIVMILFLALLTILISSIVPEIVDSLKNILNNMQSYLDNTQAFLQKQFKNLRKTNPELVKFINDKFTDLEKLVLSLVNNLLPQIENLFSKDGLFASVTGSAWSLIIGLKDFFIGLVVAVYLLSSKEIFQRQAKKMVCGLFSIKNSRRILIVSKDANNKFISFLVGKAIDSFIIGMLCFIVLTIMKMPYIALISLIVGVTNMIPFFGPFFGAIPSGLLILLSQPEKTIPFVIFILILQQFDGNILGPKILGNQLGISAFWILVSILIGGGLFNFVGMILAVPFFAVLQPIIKSYIEDRLSKKGLKTETDAYENIEDIVAAKQE